MADTLQDKINQRAFQKAQRLDRKKESPNTIPQEWVEESGLENWQIENRKENINNDLEKLFPSQEARQKFRETELPSWMRTFFNQGVIPYRGWDKLMELTDRSANPELRQEALANRRSGEYKEALAQSIKKGTAISDWSLKPSELTTRRRQAELEREEEIGLEGRKKQQEQEMEAIRQQQKELEKERERAYKGRLKSEGAPLDAQKRRQEAELAEQEAARVRRDTEGEEQLPSASKSRFARAMRQARRKAAEQKAETKSRIVDLATAPAKKGTGRLLQMAWLNLIDTAGFSWLYIAFHFLMAYFTPLANLFPKFGHEWVPEQGPNKKEAERVGATIEPFEIAGCLIIGCIILLIISLIILMIFMMAYVYSNPKEALALVWYELKSIIGGIFD